MFTSFTSYYNQHSGNSVQEPYSLEIVIRMLYDRNLIKTIAYC